MNWRQKTPGTRIPYSKFRHSEAIKFEVSFGSCLSSRSGIRYVPCSSLFKAQLEPFHQLAQEQGVDSGYASGSRMVNLILANHAVLCSASVASRIA